jgi:hypothetical protein
VNSPAACELPGKSLLQGLEYVNYFTINWSIVRYRAPANSVALCHLQVIDSNTPCCRIQGSEFDWHELIKYADTACDK